MKLTKPNKATRHNLYKEGKERCITYKFSNICDILIEVYCFRYSWDISYNDIFIIFPEFIKYKPIDKKIKELWWNRNIRVPRLDVFDKLIEETNS